jgi:hypothetical protein
MRRVYALLRLVRRYGEARVQASCTIALAHRMFNVHRLEKMLKHPLPPPSAPARLLPPARYLRDPRQYALGSTSPAASGQLPLLVNTCDSGARS